MASIVKIAIAQINCTVGDLAGNAAKILEYCERARSAGAALVLTPELALCGYPPEDLLLRDGFYRDCKAALEGLARKVGGITLVVGHPHQFEGKRHNAASLLRVHGRGDPLWREYLRGHLGLPGTAYHAAARRQGERGHQYLRRCLGSE